MILRKATKRLTEAVQYLDHVGGQLQKDFKKVHQIAGHQLDLQGYTQALDHIQAAVSLLKFQQGVLTKQQNSEQEDFTSTLSTPIQTTQIQLNIPENRS